MNTNYLDMHHIVAGVPLFPKRMKFYPNDAEKTWANEVRSTLNPYVVVGGAKWIRMFEVLAIYQGTSQQTVQS